METNPSKFRLITGGFEAGLGQTFDGQFVDQKASWNGHLLGHVGPQWKFSRNFDFNPHLFVQHTALAEPFERRATHDQGRGWWTGGVKLELKLPHVGSPKKSFPEDFGIVTGLEFGSHLLPTGEVKGLYHGGYSGFCGPDGGMCVMMKAMIHSFNRDIGFIKANSPRPNFGFASIGVFFSMALDKF